MEIDRNFKNILLIQIGRLGDYLVTTGFINALRKKFPKARLTLVISKKGAPLARKSEDIDDIKFFSDWINPFANFKFFFPSKRSL